VKGVKIIAETYNRIRASYALDIRALSLMRVLAALVLLADLIIRSTSFTAHYTKDGAVPFREVASAWWRDGYFSLYQYSDEAWYAGLLFALTGLVYFCLLIGYRTRIMSVLAWLLLLSLQNRNHAVLQCGDDQLRLLLFWGIFLPWGNFYSVDARRYPSLQNETRYFDVPGIAYVFLIFSVYFFTGILKDSAEWDSREGTAFYYALNLDQLAWPLGKHLLQYPGLLKGLTITARWLEVLTPFLLFIPYRNAFCRTVAVGVLASFHIAIALTLFVGLFYLISIVSLAGLLSPGVMDKLEKIFRLKRPQADDDPLRHISTVYEENYYFRVVRNCFVFFCMSLCFIWNLSSVERWGLRVSDRMFKFGYVLRLDQRWNMFAPNVVKVDGWMVMDAFTASGTHIDINRNGAPVDYAKPHNVLEHIKDDRWRKYQENYVITDNQFMHIHYCRYLLKDWNARHPETPVDTLAVVFMKEVTPPPGAVPKVEKDLTCKCWK
jgi:hypothetical protein